MFTKNDNNKIYIVFEPIQYQKKLDETEIVCIYDNLRETLNKKENVTIYLSPEMAQRAAIERRMPMDLPTVSLLSGTVEIRSLESLPNRIECPILCITLPYSLRLQDNCKQIISSDDKSESLTSYNIPLTDLGIWFDYDLTITLNGKDCTVPKGTQHHCTL
jgi:hypothetical protein